MMMDGFGDYYCLVLMIQMGPGVMYVVVGWTGLFTVNGYDDDVWEMLLTFYVMTGILHEHLYDMVLCQFYF